MCGCACVFRVWPENMFPSGCLSVIMMIMSFCSNFSAAFLFYMSADKLYVTFKAFDFCKAITLLPTWFLTYTAILSSVSSTLFSSTTLEISTFSFYFQTPLCHATTSCLHVLHHFHLCHSSAAVTAESRENSFSRSRSSSVSSIDRDTKEAITTLQFGESYGRKGDAMTTSCLWVGTSLGVVLLIPMSIPTDQEERMEEPVTIGPSGRS